MHHPRASQAHRLAGDVDGQRIALLALPVVLGVQERRYQGIMAVEHFDLQVEYPVAQFVCIAVDQNQEVIIGVWTRFASRARAEQPELAQMRTQSLLQLGRKVDNDRIDGNGMGPALATYAFAASPAAVARWGSLSLNRASRLETSRS